MDDPYHPRELPPRQSSPTSGRSMTTPGSAHPPDTGPPRLDLVYDRNLETPADALRLLCSVADGDHTPVEDRPPSQESVGGDLWKRWAPVREGLLTSNEAAALVGFYGRNINPNHPIVPSQLFEPSNISLLLREPVLVGAITCVAARYADLGQSFDPREPSRSRIVQARLVEWLLLRIAYITMGS